MSDFERVLRIPLDKLFEEAYFTHRLWMFFRETTDIHRIFNQVREKMKQRITLKKKRYHGKLSFCVCCVTQVHQSAYYLR